MLQFTTHTFCPKIIILKNHPHGHINFKNAFSQLVSSFIFWVPQPVYFVAITADRDP
jgi:hypothetical protein